MSQRNLYRDISRATGETVRTIEAMGFVPLEPLPEDAEEMVIDWDQLQAQQAVSLMPPRRLPAVA